MEERSRKDAKPSRPAIRVGLVNLGCPKNLVDSEVMLGLMGRSGFEWVHETEAAEVIVINTCGFIDAAKLESINTIIEHGKLKRNGNCRVLIAAGCLAQRYPDELLKELPELDAVVGTGDFPKIAEITRELLGKGLEDRGRRLKAGGGGVKSSASVSLGLKPLAGRVRQTDSPTYLYNDATPRNRLSPKHWAYVKVSEGCNYRCSFCAIPSFRGDLVSRPVEDIEAEVRRLSAEGVKEINLIAQSLTSYGWDRREKNALIPMLKRLAAIEGPRWFRLFYTYPTDLTDALLDFIAGEPKICNYVDLPLQHINDDILRKMNRKGSSRLIRDLLSRIRRTIPGVTLRSTFIVGFPGETEPQFEEIAEFIHEIGFDRLGVFTYSQEDQTSAFALGDPIPAEVKAERRRRLLEIQSEIVSKKHQALIGTVQEVMVEGPSQEPEWPLEGRMESQAPEIDGVVYLEGDRTRAGDFARVEMTGAIENDLIGRPLPGSA